MDLVEFAQKGDVRAAQSPNLSTKKLLECTFSPLATWFEISVILTLHLLGKFPYLPLLCLRDDHSREIAGIIRSPGVLLHTLYLVEQLS